MRRKTIQAKEILAFIDKFRSAENLFLYGMCYWFAVILKQRFGGGTIVHDPVANHFMWLYDGAYYDVQGAHKAPQRVETMAEIARDKMYHERILRDCVRKDG